MKVSIKESVFLLAPAAIGARFLSDKSEILGQLGSYVVEKLSGCGLGSLHQDKNVTSETLEKLVNYLLAGALSSVAAAQARKYLIYIMLHYKGYVTQPKSKLTMAWGAAMKALVYDNPGMHTYDKLLPKLPLPRVEDTIEMIKKSLVPSILTNSGKERLQLFEQACEDFIRDTRKAQRLLYLRSWYKSSWLADLWTDYAYLSYRGSLVPRSNYFLADTMHHFTLSPAARAANVIYWTNEFHNLAESRNFEPIIGMGIIPTSMHTYANVSSTRIPGQEIDKLVNTVQSRHVVIFIRGQAYKVETYHRGEMIRPEILQAQIQEMIESDRKRRNDSSPTFGLPILTSMKRPDWHQIREKMMADPASKKIIQTIESARFTLSIENAHPISDDQEHKIGCFGGEVGNLWYDQSMSFVICENGRMAMNFEHSIGEATLSGLFCLHYCRNELFDYRGNAVLKKPFKNADNKKIPCLWSKLDIDGLVSRNQLQPVLQKAAATLSAAKEDFSNILVETPYGKGWIKKQKLSPDAFMQIMLQRTFYKLNGFIPKVYESAGIIMYRDSRTETIRSVSQDSVDYCLKPNIESLRKACTAQTNYKLDCVLGKGADRHLFALYVVGRYLEQKYSLFEDFPEIWKMDDVSSSSTGVPMDIPIQNLPKAGSFGAQLDDGFGVAYFTPFDWCVGVAISAYKKTNKYSAKDFAECLWDCMLECRQMFEPEYGLNYRHDDMIAP